MKELVSWFFATLMLAVIVHIITIHSIPYVIMNRVMHGIVKNAGAENRPDFPALPTAMSRGVVRPSPDLLYVVCTYDVRKGPVRLTAPVPDSYWSLSLFASNSDNFFVINDRELPAKQADLLLLAEDQKGEPRLGEIVVRAPSDRGIVLFRTLVPSPDALEALDRLRRQSNCAPA